VSSEVVTLPLHSNMRVELVDRIIGCIRRFFDAGLARPSLTVRPARRVAEEADLLVAWRKDPRSREMFYRAEFTRADYERTHFEHDAPGAVWIDGPGGAPVGALRFRRYAQFQPPLPSPLAGLAAFDISVIVAPDARGRGLAHRCIQLASDHAVGAGAELLVAEVKSENTRSRRAFERAGYLFLDEVEKHIAGREPVKVVRLIFPDRT
jgi:RimJ/RimL family protein N-acetyltransferase